jgi:hypothetical protein
MLAFLLCVFGEWFPTLPFDMLLVNAGCLLEVSEAGTRLA